MPTATTGRAIDRLKAAANLKPIKKVVVLNNGDEFVLYHRPLTMAQRDRATKNAKSDAAGDLALQLLIEVAMDENGQRMFNAGDMSEMRHWCRDEDMQKLMLAVLSNEEEDADEPPAQVNMKRTSGAASEG